MRQTNHTYCIDTHIHTFRPSQYIQGSLGRSTGSQEASGGDTRAWKGGEHKGTQGGEHKGMKGGAHKGMKGGEHKGMNQGPYMKGGERKGEGRRAQGHEPGPVRA